MGEVTISVAGRAYQVVCEDGEENRLTSIAARVDREAQVFGGATPSLSEPRLLLMCALLLADKLDEAEGAPQAALSPAAPSGAEVDLTFVDEATARIEALAHTNGDDAPVLSDDETEEVTAAQSGVQPERRSKSSAAVAAEKDLLSWAERSDPRVEDDAETAPDPAAIPSNAAQDETPTETEEESAARERAERRRRRRERLARLAKQDGDDQ